MLPILGPGLLWLKRLRPDMPRRRWYRRLTDELEETAGVGFAGTSPPAPPPPPPPLLRSDVAPLAPRSRPKLQIFWTLRLTMICAGPRPALRPRSVSPGRGFGSSKP